MRTEYRRDLQHSYLVIIMEEMEEISYPIRMITENQIPGLLSCSCKRIDKDLLLYYDISARVPLSERCLCRKVTGDEVISLVRKLLKALGAMEEYLLDGNSLCLKPEYIYTDPQMEEIQFCYIPGENRNAAESFRELLEGILPVLDHQRQEEMMVGYGLYHYAVQGDFSIDGLRQHLEQYGRERRKDCEGAKTDSEELAESGEFISKSIVKDSQEWDTDRIEREKHEAALEAFFQAEEPEEKDFRFSAVGIMTAIVGIYGLAGWCLWRNYPDYLWMWGGAGLILLAVIFLFFVVKKKRCKTEKPEEKPEENPEQEMKKNDRSSEYNREQILSGMEYEEFGRERHRAEKYENADFTRVLQPASQNGIRTYTGVYILEEKIPYPGRMVHLKDENIQFWGQMEGMADVILPSQAVSRLHARVRREEGRYYLQDLNSRNGTWVNQQQVPVNQEIEIKEGDEIRLADLVYHFRRV